MGIIEWLWSAFCELFTQILRITGLGYYLQDLIGQADSLELFLETKKSLIKTYGPIHFPFFEGSFTSVKKEFIKREQPNLILLVYCHADNSPFAQQTMTDIICEKETASSFDRPDVITWMCDVRSNLTYYYLTQKLGYEGVFPAFLFLSEFKGKLRMESSIQAPLSKKQLIEEMNEVLSNFEIRKIMEEEGNSSEMKSESQLIREDQDAAYQQSLEADKRKREEKLAREEAEKKAQDEAERAQAAAKAKEEHKRKLMETIKAELPSEPSASEQGCVTLSIQLPGGKRCTRRFLIESTLSDVYNFCACELDRVPDDFMLKIPLPLTELADRSLTLSDYGIIGSIKLVAEFTT